MSHLCKTWNIQIYRLTKICEQFDIPRPGPDYWPLLRLNQTVERTPLPPAASSQPSVIRITPQTVAKQPAKLSTQPVQPVAASDVKSSSDNPDELAKPAAPLALSVAQDFRKAHPLIRACRELLEKAEPDKYGRVGPNWRQRCINITVTKQNLKRALLILDTIFRALESKGYKAELSEDRYERLETVIKIGDEKVRIKMMERTLRRDRELTEKEKAERYVWNRHVYEPTDILNFSIEEYHGPTQKIWTDKKRQPLEEVLDEIVNGIVATGDALRLYRIAEAEREQRRAEQARREHELRQLYEQELNRRRSLEQQADRWEKAAQLRAFITACEARLKHHGTDDQNASAKRWLEWARASAEELDPLNGNYLERAINSLPNPIIKFVVKEND